MCAACGASHSGAGPDGGAAPEGSRGTGPGGSGSGTTTGSGSGTTTGSGTGAGTGPIGASLLKTLGKGPPDRRRQRLRHRAAAAPTTFVTSTSSGGLFTSSTPCTACGASCSSSWWGCYNSPPGDVRHAASCRPPTSASPAQVPMFTYYEILQTAQATISGFQEGTAEVTAGRDQHRHHDALLQRLAVSAAEIGSARRCSTSSPTSGATSGRPAIPTTLAAAVGSVNPTDCASLPSTIAGMGQCMIAMVRKYAPNALVGLQASAWNIASNTDTSVDVTHDAQQVAAVLSACGQVEADFVVVETSDRDAGYYQIGRDARTRGGTRPTRRCRLRAGPDLDQGAHRGAGNARALLADAARQRAQSEHDRSLPGQPRRLLLRRQRRAGQ